MPRNPGFHKAARLRGGSSTKTITGIPWCLGYSRLAAPNALMARSSSSRQSFPKAITLNLSAASSLEPSGGAIGYAPLAALG